MISDTIILKECYTSSKESTALTTIDLWAPRATLKRASAISRGKASNGDETGRTRTFSLTRIMIISSSFIMISSTGRKRKEAKRVVPLWKERQKAQLVAITVNSFRRDSVEAASTLRIKELQIWNSISNRVQARRAGSTTNPARG